jgi:hypothetical protein
MTYENQLSEITVAGVFIPDLMIIQLFMIKG